VGRWHWDPKLKTLRVLVAWSASALLASCGGASETSRVLNFDASEFDWSALHAVDLTEVSPGLASFGCGSDTQRATFEEFRLVSDSQRAVLSASLCETRTGTTPVARPYGRVYFPVELEGEGWASSGAHFKALAAASLGYMRDLTSAISPDGRVRTVFWDFDGGTGSGEATWTSDAGFTDLRTGSVDASDVASIDINPNGSGFQARDSGLQSFDAPFDLWNGFTKELAWDGSGNVRLARLNVSNEPWVQVAPPISGAWTTEASDFNPDGAATPSSQLKLLFDGYRTVLLWIAQNPTASRSVTSTATSRLYTIHSDDTTYWDASTSSVPDTQALNPLSNSLTRAFDAATDQAGTVVAVYLSKHSDETAVACSTLAKFCATRLYASVQSPNGLWTGPMPLDEVFQLSKTTTTYAQDSDDTFTVGANLNFSASQPGLQFSTPRVVYLGEDRFLVTAVISDYSDPDAPVTRIFSRAYTVGGGWDATSETFLVDEFTHEESTLGGQVTYRPVNEITLASNGQGGALLVAQITNPDSEYNQGDAETREWVHVTYFYTDGEGWSEQLSIPDERPCPALAFQDSGAPNSSYLTACPYIKQEAAVFPNWESVIVFPMPTNSSISPLRLGLYSVELKKREAE
jgi:hypothetical protein